MCVSKAQVAYSLTVPFGRAPFTIMPSSSPATMNCRSPICSAPPPCMHDMPGSCSCRLQGVCRCLVLAHAEQEHSVLSKALLGLLPIKDSIVPFWGTMAVQLSSNLIFQMAPKGPSKEACLSL